MKLIGFVCEIKSRKGQVIFNNEIEDRTTTGLVYEKKILMLQGNKGPNEFWKFDGQYSITERTETNKQNIGIREI